MQTGQCVCGLMFLAPDPPPIFYFEHRKGPIYDHMLTKCWLRMHSKQCCHSNDMSCMCHVLSHHECIRMTTKLTVSSFCILRHKY